MSSFGAFSQAGSCDSSVPVYNVDLSGSSSDSWEVTGIIRDGSCCSYSHPPSSCVQFIVTLNEDAEGIIFSVTDGALPQSLTWQLMNTAGDYCEPTEYPADTAVCLNGVGPHTIIFCKPGGNDNTYTISSVPAPAASGDIIVNDGCTDIIQAFGFDPTTIEWNSIYPGEYGEYDDYLDCDDCEIVTVTGQEGLPAYIDYQVCGLPLGSCNPALVCDTVRATFNNTLFVDILPEQPTVCYGGVNTTITANGIGGSPPYNYLWSTGATTQSINVGVGTYIVTIGDISGCPPNYDTVTVTAFTSTIEANAGADIDICANNFPVQLSGTIQAASGGIWWGGGGTYNPSNVDLNAEYTPSNAELYSGSATLYLTTTGNGTCPADTDEVNISIHIFNAEISSQTNVSCYGGSDGTATVNVTAGTMPFVYNWSDGETTATAINLEAGTHSVTVSDFYGCEEIFSTTLTEPTEITATSSSTSANCGGNTGTATITPSGGTPSYTYNWETGGTTQTILSVSHGIYDVTVTDSKGCQEVFNVYVDDLAPPFVDITSSTDVKCNGENTGNATVTITTPGVGVHTYNWNSTPPQTTATATGLPAGTYTVVVTDEDGCTGQDVVTISEPNPINIAFTNSDIACYGQNTGSSNTNVTGGTYPYEYLWSTGAVTNFIINKPAGDYYLTVTDDSGCVKIDTTTITQPPLLSFATTSVTNVKCHGQNNGAITITVQGGVYPYTYSWLSGQTTSILSNLYAGNYAVTVTGANGCSIDTSFAITEPDTLGVTSIIQNVSCFAGTDGAINASISGGTPGYYYLWSNGATTEDVSGLSSGNYNIMIRDANNCTYIQSVAISQPTEIQLTLSRINVKCYGESNGQASVSASGGTPNYTYLWSNGATQYNTNNDLSTAIYTVTVTDSKGCQADTSIQIYEPPQLEVLVDVDNISCNGYDDGEIDITVNGGIYPYTYVWSNAETTEDVQNLSQGGYFVEVTDYNGCVEYGNAVIDEPLPLSLSTSITDAKCYSSADGIANLIVSGGTSPYSYAWSNGDTNEDLDSVVAGTYYVTVLDTNLCQAQITAIIGRPDEIVISFTPQNPTCYGKDDGEVNTSITGGTPNFTYLWDEQANSQTTYQAYNLNAGTLYLTVTDANNCTKVDSVTLSQPNEIFVTGAGGDTICPGFNTSISASATGGVGNPYTYLWNNGLGSGQNQSVNPNETTYYAVIASDANYCPSSPDTIAVFVRNLYPENLSVSSAGDICVGETTTISGSYYDEYGGYTLTWSDSSGIGQTPFNVSPDTTTVYTLTVTNICNNSISESVTVNVNDYPEISLTGEIANGCEPFEVSLLDNTLPANYTYLWNFGDGDTSSLANPTHTYLENGTYNITLTVTSDKGCTSSSNGDSYVIVYDNPKPSLQAYPPFSDIRKPTHLFSVLSPEILSVIWDFGDADTSSMLTPQHTYSDTGTFVASAQTVNEYGCLNSNTITVIVNPYYDFGVPNAFTPNPNGPSGGSYNINDPNNDIFFPITQFVKNFKMSIFNRWGELIFESLDINIGWDGYYRDELCKQDVYIWKIEVEYTNGKVDKRTGYVTLIR